MLLGHCCMYFCLYLFLWNIIIIEEKKKQFCQIPFNIFAEKPHSIFREYFSVFLRTKNSVSTFAQHISAFLQKISVILQKTSRHVFITPFSIFAQHITVVFNIFSVFCITSASITSPSAI